MEKITTKEKFLEVIQGVHAVEVKARDEYLWDFNHVSDEEIKSTLLRIKNDEDNHIALLDEIIEIFEHKVIDK